MNFRFLGLVPAVALMGLGTAFAQGTPTPGSGGQMAFPTPLPSGEITTTAPRGADTGNMAYPNRNNGIQTTGPSAPPSPQFVPRRGRAAPMGTAGGNMPPMRPDVAPTPAQSAAARSLADAPSAAPIPYTDFDAPKAMPAGRGGRMMHKPMAHRAAAHRAVPRGAAAATPAPATPAPAPAAPAK